MQRFKDFTKKSGKVASAILSAAMVTSMVAGTNVVYAAEANTQPVDVTAVDTQEEGEATAREIVEKLAAAYENITVTAATSDGAFLTVKDYTQPKEDIMANYNSADYTATLQYSVDKKPTATETGTASLTITVTATGAPSALSAPSDARILTYTLPSGNDRAKEVAAAVQSFMNEKVIITRDTTKEKVAEKVYDFLKNTKGGEYGEIPLYADVKTSTATDITPESEQNGETVKYTMTAELTDGTAAFTPDSVKVKATATKTIATSESLVNSANADVAAYLDALGTTYFASTTTAASVDTLIDEFLEDKGYDDFMTVSTASPVTFTVKEKPGKINDGLATVSYKLESREKTADQKPIATAETKDKEVKLASFDDKAEQIMTDLLAVAEAVDVDSKTEKTTVAGKGYQEAFVNEFNKAHKVVKIGADKPALKNDFKTIDNIKNIYGADESGTTVEFEPAAATSDKDAKPFATITTKVGNVTKTRTYVYDVASAQTAVVQAQAAVEKAWANMTITNDTTADDAKKVAEEALKAYPTVTLGTVTYKPVLATATTEGTAKISATLTDTRNDVTKEAKAERTFKFRANCFVEENGKTYYYNKEGKVGTADKGYFLQGTDSPDGYTYFVQNDGSIYKDRLTYHPNGKDVIYFDKDGHEVFDAFVNVKKDVAGNAVDYIGYFDTLGYAYVNQTTYGNGEGAYAKDALFYINDYGVLENKGWFQNAAGEIGYAATNGTLTTSQWSLDQFGRKVYFQANGFLAKGLMTDGVKYYQLDETDGHLVGEF